MLPLSDLYRPRFLYHGSPYQKKMLSPSLPEYIKLGRRRRELFEREAVYASDSKEIAKCFAVGRKPDEKGRLKSGVFWNPDKKKFQMYFEYGTPFLGQKGYIYTVSSKGFIPIPNTNQYYSIYDVKPFRVETYNIDDLSSYWTFGRLPKSQDVGLYVEK